MISPSGAVLDMLPFLNPHRMSQSNLDTSSEIIQFAPQHRLYL